MATTVGVKLKIDGEKEYKQSIKNINQETKTLDAQLKSVSKAFDEEKNGMTKAEKQSELLKQKQEALSKELDQMNDYLDKVNEAYGENSIQAMKVEEQIAKTEAKLADTNSALEDLADGSDTSSSALEDLTSTIADQESQLDDLREQYVNAVLEFGEGSDEANNLAGEISDLSEELNNNKTTLDEANSSYDDIIGAQSDLQDSMGEVSGTASQMGGQFGNTIGGMVTAITAGDLMSSLGAVVGIVQDIVEAEKEVAENWDISEANIVEGTGVVGEALEQLEAGAKEAWAAVGYEGFDESTAGNVTANLNTFFGITDEDQIADITEAIADYANLTGEDAAQTVEDLNSVMQAWGMYTGDTTKDIQTMKDLMEQFYAASTQSGAGASELMNALADNEGNFENFNWNMSESVDRITQFCKTGGSADEFTGAIDKIYKKMHDKSDDLSGIWDSVMESIQNCGNEQEYLLTEIEGVSINDIMTYNKAKSLYDRLHNAYVTPLEEVGTAKAQVISDYDEIIEKAETFTERMEENRRAIQQQTGSGFLANFWSTLQTTFAGTEGSANFWKSIGSFLGYDTSNLSFADGYDQAYILSNPTIFGTSSNGTPLLGGDRAGNEVVVGESHLLSMIQSAVSSDGKMDTMINLLAQYLPQMNNQNIYLDGDVLVGQTASKMDRALGRL